MNLTHQNHFRQEGKDESDSVAASKLQQTTTSSENYSRLQTLKFFILLSLK